MKKARKILLTILSVLTLAALSLGAASCELIGLIPPLNSSTSQTTDNEFRQVYAMYVTYAEEQGVTPLSYEAWLMSIRGEKGDKGEQGPAGADGEDGVGIEKVELDEDGNLVITLTDGTVLDPIELPSNSSSTEQESLRYQKIKGEEAYRVIGIGTVSDYDVVIPKMYKGLPVTEIGAHAFENEQYISSITISDNITTIGEGAFYQCANLTSVVIGDSVTTIGSSAFRDCSSLASVYITDIEAWCNISFSSNDVNPLHYGANLYLNNELVTELVIPDSVTSIGDYAFRYCSSLTSVVIPDSVTSIGNSAFAYCSRLTSVVIGNGVTSIGYVAFRGCSSLTSVEIPDSVTSIGDEAFLGCFSLTSVEIGDSVTSIGGEAFYGCSSLTSVVIPDGVTSIGDDAFYNCRKLVEVVNKSTHITVEQGSESNGRVGYYALAVYNNEDIFESKLSNDNGYSIYTDGEEKILVGYTGTETDLVLPSYVTEINQGAFYYCSSLTSVEIPDSVTSIGDWAFYECRSLTSVVIGDSVTSIGSRAFSSCSSLTSVVIGDSVTSIGNHAFLSCSSLTSVVIPDSVTSIGNSAFSNCWSLTSVVIPDSVTSIGEWAFSSCSSLTSVVIPDSVTSIGRSAFYDCSSLTSVVIGDGVTSIGDEAFAWCSSLTSVYYKGTESEWDAIWINSWSNSYLTDAQRYYYSETQPTEEGNYWHYVDGKVTVW